MSIALMTAAFKARLSPTNKFVLVALCDNANDQGECYPSVPMLCEKTSLSDRAVQKSLVTLEQSGIIKRDMRRGRSTYYFIADPATWSVPSPELRSPSPRTTFTPGPDSPPNHVHPTPERGSPITIKEPSSEPSGNHQKTREAFVLPDWIPKDAWQGFEEMRKRKGKPMTERARALIVKTLKALHEAGNDVAAILDRSTVNAWTDVYAPKPAPSTNPGAAMFSRRGATPQDIAAQRRADNEEAKRLLFGAKQSEVIDV